MRFLNLRSRLSLIVALAALPACGSVFPDSCPHQVVDKSFSVAIDTATACVGAAEQERGFEYAPGPTVAWCRKYCNDPAITHCSLPYDFMSRYEQAIPLISDAGAPACPMIPDGGTTVALMCEQTHYEGTQTNGCPVEGRRPAGLLVAERAAAASVVGTYFAECAHLEAASVIAFRAMRAELVAHGAPERLVLAAERAEREEIRHTELARGLAERFGGVFAEAHAESAGVRTIAEIAIENVVEGVVRETYGAVVALWRAEHAGDDDVRAAMREIAEDECRHAALSWEVATWARAQLDDAERAVIDAAMRAAIRELAHDVAGEPSRALREIAGVPSASEAARMVAELERAVWSAAA